MMKQSLGDLTHRAQAIIQGKVAGITQEWNDDKTMIYTTVRVSTGRIVKGEKGLKEVIVRQPGGMIGDKGVKVSGFPAFSEGEEVLLFLEPFEAKGPHSGKHKIVGMGQGKFRIETDTKTGRKTVVPSREMPTLLDAQGHEVTPEKGPVPLDDFIHTIEQEMSRK